MSRYPTSIAVYEEDYRKKVAGEKGILHPSEDLIRLVARGSFAATTPGEAVLDFGVGDGRHVSFLLSLGYRVTGTDVAPAAVALTERNFSDDHRYVAVQLDGEQPLPLPFEDASFALVVAWEMLHWTGSAERYRETMRELVRVLQPGGTILCTMPTEDHYLKRWSLEVGTSTYLCKTETRYDCLFFSPNLFTLRALFGNELGLTVDQTLRYEYGSTTTEPSLDHRMSFYGFALRRS
jgi:SAM-dependent methyltransferase